MIIYTYTQHKNLKNLENLKSVVGSRGGAIYGEVIFIHHPNSIFGTINICCSYLQKPTLDVFGFVFIDHLGPAELHLASCNSHQKKSLNHNGLEIEKWCLDTR